MAANYGSIKNSPTFSMERSRSAKVGSLQLLSNLRSGQHPKRNIVLATSLTPESAAALAWVVNDLAQKGDAIHLAHVVKCLHTRTEIFHSGPGNAYSLHEEPHHERQDVLRAQSYIKEKLIPLLEAAGGLFYDVHVFVDTENAPPDAIGGTIMKLATELGATAIALAANDTAGSDPQRLGSMAQWVVSQASQPIPIIMVRGQAPAEAPAESVSNAAAAAIAIVDAQDAA